MRTQPYVQSSRKLQGEDGQRRRLLISNKPKYQVIIDRGWSAAKQIMHDVTSNIYDSFVNLRASKKSPQQMYRNRKPSSMTIQLIKQIHHGFDPLEMSANRWMCQLEDESKKQKKDVDQMLFNQQLLNARNSQIEPKRKKIFTIIQNKVENPKPFEVILWKIAEDNITASKKKLEEIQKEEKVKQEKLQPDILNLIQVKPTEEKLDETNKIGSGNQSVVAAVTDQKKATEQPQPKQPTNTQNKGSESEIPNKQIFNSPTKLKLTSSLIIENKQPELNKGKPLDTPKKVDNPFMAPVSKPLSFADLHGFKTDIFGNNITQTNSRNNNQANNNYTNNSQLPFPVKNDAPLWLNNRSRDQNCKVELIAELFNNVSKNVAPTIKNNAPFQTPIIPTPKGNPFEQSKPLSVVKKGLAPGQITSATIFKSNQTFQNQPSSKEVSQFSQMFSSGANSNERAKQMFSNHQAPAPQPQSLFDLPSTSRQNTEKKGRNNRRVRKEKQTRIN